MSKARRHTMTFTRSSEAPDGTVTGEEDVRVTFDFYPADRHPKTDVDGIEEVFVAGVEVERLVDGRLAFVPVPNVYRRGDFDYHEWVEDRRDDMIEHGIAAMIADMDRRDDAKIARIRGKS